MKKESAFHLTLLEDSDNGTEFSFGDKSNSDFLFTLDGLSAVLRKLQGKKTRRFLWVPKTTQIQLKYKDSVFMVTKKNINPNTARVPQREPFSVLYKKGPEEKTVRKNDGMEKSDARNGERESVYRC